MSLPNCLSFYFIRAVGQKGKTALKWATEKGHAEVVYQLLLTGEMQRMEVSECN
jgi:hypothetical protein